MNALSRLCVSAALFWAVCCLAHPAYGDPIRPQWPQPDGPGTPVVITYSYSNLLNGSLLFLSPAQLRAATEEALGLWASYAPLHFVERADSGPAPSDISYQVGDYPQIRLGHHPMNELAHAYFPSESDGLGGDVHIDQGLPWTIGEGHWNLLEAITHELGHALGLDHEFERSAIMNTSYPQRRFHGPGTAFLFPADIDNIRAIYGAGSGSVQPLPHVPEPATGLLVATAISVVAYARRRGKHVGWELRSRPGR